MAAPVIGGAPREGGEEISKLQPYRQGVPETERWDASIGQKWRLTQLVRRLPLGELVCS
jgi:hypothetical protein